MAEQYVSLNRSTTSAAGPLRIATFATATCTFSAFFGALSSRNLAIFYSRYSIDVFGGAIITKSAVP